MSGDGGGRGGGGVGLGDTGVRGDEGIDGGGDCATTPTMRKNRTRHVMLRSRMVYGKKKLRYSFRLDRALHQFLQTAIKGS